MVDRRSLRDTPNGRDDWDVGGAMAAVPFHLYGARGNLDARAGRKFHPRPVESST